MTNVNKTNNFSVVAYITATVCGSTVWLGVSKITGMTEAWDSGLYYVYGLPIMITFSCALGFLSSQRPWRWPLTIVASQALVAVVQNPLANLLPLGLIVFGILVVPNLPFAYLGAFLRKKHEKRRAESNNIPPVSKP